MGFIRQMKRTCRRARDGKLDSVSEKFLQVININYIKFVGVKFLRLNLFFSVSMLFYTIVRVN